MVFVKGEEDQSFFCEGGIGEEGSEEVLGPGTGGRDGCVMAVISWQKQFQ